MIDDGLFQHLTAAGTTTNGLIGKRLFPLVVPEPCDVWPSGTQQLVSNVETRTLDDGGDPVEATARILFEGWGKTKADAQAVIAAIRADLKNFTGALPSGDVVANAWPIALSTRYVAELELYLVQATWMFLYTPAA